VPGQECGGRARPDTSSRCNAVAPRLLVVDASVSASLAKRGQGAQSQNCADRRVAADVETFESASLVLQHSDLAGYGSRPDARRRRRVSAIGYRARWSGL